MKLRVRRIEKAQDFVTLAPVWAQLAKESGHLSPFLSYDWFWCCWHAVWPQRHPEILVVEEMGTPVAIVPLMHWRTWTHGVPIRYVSFLECPHTPTVDLLTAGQHDRVIAMFLDHLTSRADWDIAWLQKLPITSPTVATLEKLLPGRLPWRRTGHSHDPYIAIDGGWARFSRAATALFTDTQHDSHTQLRGAGDIRIEEHRSVDLHSPVLQEVLAAMSCSRWTDHCAAIPAMARAPEFFRELTRRASKNSWLSLWSLRRKGQVIAIEYQLRSNGKVQVLWAGDDPDYRGFRPGRMLQLAILQSLFEAGRVSEYAMGSGVKDDRRLWATAWRQSVHLKLYRTSLYARLLHRLETEMAPEGTR